MTTHIEKIGNIETANFYHGDEKLPLPSNIPLPKGFIGREVELSALNESDATAFVFHGAGGVGKTELALEFIRRIKSDYKAHIRIDMRGLSKENHLKLYDAKLEVIRAFEPKVPADLSEQDIDNLYNSFLNQHKTILFFDNAKDREQVESLNTPSAFVVITSRNTFNVTGGFSIEVEHMSSEDARNLLYSIVEEERFNGQADKLADLAGYLPMALLPLASLLADDVTLEITDLIQTYSDRKEVLHLADPNRENQSVKASFDLSYETLSEELKERWRKLAVLSADVDLEAMQFIWQIKDGNQSRSELIKKHLLHYDIETKRSKMHDLARDYTSELLSEKELFQAEGYHCVYFGELLASLDKATLPNLTKFDLEQINIEKGFTWLTDKVENEAFAQFCGSYVGYANNVLMLRLHFREYIKWLETGLKASQVLNNKQQISSDLSNLGIAYRNLGEYKKAIEYQEQALALAKENRDRRGEGSYLSNLGTAHFNLGKYKKAIWYHEQALAIAKETNDQEDEGNRLGNLANVYSSLGENKKAIGFYNQSLEIAKKMENRTGEGINLGNLGNSYHKLGEYEKAIGLYEQSLAIAKELGNKTSEGDNLGNLGNSYRKLGEYEKAIGLYEQSLAIAKEIGDRQGECNRLGNLGNAYSILGERDKSIEYKHKAIDYHKQSLAISIEIGDRSGEGNSLGNLGISYSSLGETDKAKGYYQQAIAILDAIESPNAAFFQRNLAKLKK